MKTILLKFSGPMQSWGTCSHFETRHTDFYPSKSAVVGIIAASLGYRRDDFDNIKKLNELNFAVRIDQSGRLLKDYHTAKKYKKNGSIERTYVTNRYYLEDAVFVVVVSHEDDRWIREIEKSLRNPWFQPFMGRRSLPVNADFFIGIEDSGSIDSLKQLEWQAADWYKKRYHERLVRLEAFADAALMQTKHGQLRKDRIISFSQKERKFGFRYETRFFVNVSNKLTEKTNTEHDIWSNMGY